MFSHERGSGSNSCGEILTGLLTTCAIILAGCANRSDAFPPDAPALQQFMESHSTSIVRLGEDAEELREAFLQGTRIGATPVTHGVALPHVRLESLEHPEMVLVRAREGIDISLDGVPPFGHHHTETRAFALFFLASPEDDPARHLRILAQVAGRVDEASFREEWEGARDEQALKEVLLRDERFVTLKISKQAATADFVGRALREIQMPEDTLLTVVRRHGDAFVPRGSTVLQEGDRVTVIGTPRRIRELYERYGS